MEDRGYQFSDGVYEVIAIMNGKMLDDDLHFKRLKRSLDELGIKMPMKKSSMNAVIDEVARRNRVTDGFLYLQVTRGVASRNHAIPKNMEPSLTVMFVELKPPPKQDYENGVTVVVAEDIRWKRRDIKSISLLANTLAKQVAVEAKAKEAWMVDKVSGFVTEGSSTNAYIVNEKGEVQTHPANESILGGVTRDSVIRAAKKNGIKVKEKPFTLAEAKKAREAFFTSTTAGVMPVVQIDKKKISNGKPGEVTKKLIDVYDDYMKRKTGR